MNWRTRIPNEKNEFIQCDSYGEICESIKQYKAVENKDTNSSFVIEYLDSAGEWIEVDSLTVANTGEIEVVRASHMAVV